MSERNFDPSMGRTTRDWIAVRSENRRLRDEVVYLRATCGDAAREIRETLIDVGPLLGLVTSLELIATQPDAQEGDARE